MKIIKSKEVDTVQFNTLGPGECFVRYHDSNRVYVKTSPANQVNSVELSNGALYNFPGFIKVIPYKDAEVVLNENN